MLRRLADITRWPLVLVFAAAAVLAAGLAFSTLNLFQQGMANLAFLQRHGWLAVREGAAVQLLTLSVSGVVALFCYLGFKICEGEITARYRRWTGGRKRDATAGDE